MTPQESIAMLLDNPLTLVVLRREKIETREQALALSDVAAEGMLRRMTGWTARFPNCIGANREGGPRLPLPRR